jgi:hypothetical protein
MATISFIQLAQQAQRELDGETERLAQKEADLNTRSSAVAGQLDLADKRHGELNAKEKQLQAREEEVSRRELTVRRDLEVQQDYTAAVGERTEAATALKKAEAEKDEAKMMLLDLSSRELALSEREKTYREDIKKQIASKMLGI